MIYRAKGIEEGAAERLAERIMLRPKAALDTLTREELGLNPHDLASPWVAAIASFFSFAVGAIVPVIPYTVSAGSAAFTSAAIASGLLLALVGLSISVLTGKNGFVSAFRMMMLGALAATATYFIGKAVGQSIG